MIRRDAIRELGGYRSEFRNAEDYDLWLRVSRSLAIVNMPEPLLRYRFSASGMTLGRKWEQLSFVFLAQAAHAHGSQLDDEVRSQARAMLEATDRAYFFREVAKGTVAELVALRMWANAVRIIWHLSQEIGTQQALELLKSVGGGYFRALAPRYAGGDLAVS